MLLSNTVNSRVQLYKNRIVLVGRLLALAFLSVACVSQSTSINITIPQGSENLHLEQELIQGQSLGVQMGGLGRGGGVRKSYQFDFNLKDTDLIRYAYLSIDTLGVDRPENPLYLNGHAIGFLKRAGYGINQDKWYAGQEGPKQRKKEARTQRYLPAAYFRAGKNTIEFGHQKLHKANQAGKISYEQYIIKKINLAVIKTRTLPRSPETAARVNKKRRFPDQFAFFKDLSDEELYIALVKLPYLLAELSDSGGLASDSLSYVYARIGDYYRWTGLYNKSLDYHRKANRLQAEKPPTLLTPKVRAGLALAYNFVGDYHSSVDECEKALAEIEQARALQIHPVPKHFTHKADHLEFLVSAYLAINHYHLQDASEAEYYAYRVINNFDDTWAHYSTRTMEIGRFVPLSLAYQTMGDAALRSGSYAEALNYYGEAEKYLGYEVRPAIYHDQMIAIQIGIAKTLYHQGQYDRAREILQKVKSPTNAFLWRSYQLQGMIAESENSLGQAVELYQRAIDAIEFSRARLTSHGLKINFMSDKQEPYARMVNCLVKLKQTTAAYNYVEKSKARAFLDLIARSDRAIGQKNEALKEITEEEKRLRDNLLSAQYRTEMNTRMFQERGATDTDSREIRAARGALGEFFSRWFRRNKDFASLRSADTLPIEKVQALLPADAHLVEYYFRGKQLYAWLIGPQSLQFVQKQVDEKELLELVRTYRGIISRPDAVRGLEVTEQVVPGQTQASLKTLRRKLEAILVKDILSEIPSRKIYIIPHGILHYLPFQALTLDGRYLIERFEIGYSPSASVLGHVFDKKKTVKKAVLALGNPDLGAPQMALPYAEIEVRDIQQLFNQTTILTQNQASEATFKKKAGSYDILHIASHGEFNQDTPLLSCLRLAPGGDEDGRLETAEIFDLNLNAYLVTLSACNTAMGKMASGDELMGLTRAFMFAGTPSIMSTFWSVNDKSTSVLMKHFYANLKSKDKFAAMRQAQIEMIGHPEYKHPYYWAAFQIIGDYR